MLSRTHSIKIQNIENTFRLSQVGLMVADLTVDNMLTGAPANWIAPPPIGINRQAIDFEYVRFN